MEMKYIILTICISVTLLSVNSDNAIGSTFYVATNGNDQWSGTLLQPATSGDDGPFATIHQARNVIRKLKKNGSRDAYTVYVRGGVYQLKQTLFLDLEDSGSETNPLVFKAFENEKPILSGAIKITDFKHYKDGIYKSDVEKIVNIDDVHQLYSDGDLQILARYPNMDLYNPIGGGFLYVKKLANEGSQREFIYQNSFHYPWSNLSEIQLVIFPGNNWTNNTLTGIRINKYNQTITLNEDTSHEIKPFNRYFFQNVFEELDSPREWYFDRQSKVLYFWPESYKSLETVSIPFLKSILEIRGDVNGSLSHIQFEGFTLEGCYGSSIVVRNAQEIDISGNTIYNAGKFGVEIVGGYSNTILGNDIYNVGGGGIKIGISDLDNPEPGQNRAENNYIHHVGRIFKNSSGIDCRGVGNVVAHNRIQYTPRMGITFNGRDHNIEYNHVHHVNQETQDSGVIYCSQIDWTKRGNVVRYNYLHNSGGYGRSDNTGKWQSPIETYGIYLDDWTSGTQVYGNIIADTASGGIFIHGGRDNDIENNVIMDGGYLGQMVYSAYLRSHPTATRLLPEMFSKIDAAASSKYPLLSSIKDVQTGTKMYGNSFMRNIVYFTSQESPLFGIYNDFDFETTLSDYNVIFHNNFPLLIPFLKEKADQQWATWKDKGFDRNSIIADPKFVDVTNNDFRLSSQSPALKLGFKPIPIEQIGIYEHPKRASWPVAPYRLVAPSDLRYHIH